MHLLYITYWFGWILITCIWQVLALWWTTSRDFVVAIFLGLFEVPQSLVPILTDAVVKQISEQSGASITLRQDTRTMGQVPLKWHSGQTYMSTCLHVHVYMSTCTCTLVTCTCTSSSSSSSWSSSPSSPSSPSAQFHTSSLRHFIRIHDKGTSEPSRTWQIHTIT